MPTSSTDSKLSLLFMGDFCAVNPIQRAVFSDTLKNFVLDHDFRVVNFEAPLKLESHNALKKAGPSIFQDKSVISLLQEQIFNVLTLANNHIMDFGDAALEYTIDLLKEFHIGGAGKDINAVYKPIILHKKNKKIGVISCGESQFGCARSEETPTGYAWVFSDKIPKLITKLKQELDFIILLPHAGLEMEDLPLPEWQKCYRNFIDCGVDLIIGTHPHVVQPKEQYKGKWIYYSLGNLFFNNTHKDPRWYTSLMVSCKFTESEVQLEEHFVTNKGGTLYFDDSQEKKFKDLSDTLKDRTRYLKLIDEVCVSAWKSYYESYYYYHKNQPTYNGKFYRLPYFLRAVIDKVNKRYLNQIKGRQNSVLLYHNISIETHRFVVERALRILNNIY